jgi:hypothetical protein
MCGRERLGPTPNSVAVGFVRENYDGDGREGDVRAARW